MSDDKKLEAKPEEKPQSEIQKAVSEALKEALPMAAALAAQAAVNAQPREVRAAPAPAPSGARCSECGQKDMACKGEHRMACVYPDDEEAARWFTGVKINGARYISEGLGHFITVPKDCNVEYLMQAWVQNEKIQRHGRKRMHNSGAIGGGTNNFNAFNGSGFGER